MMPSPRNVVHGPAEPLHDRDERVEHGVDLGRQVPFGDLALRGLREASEVEKEHRGVTALLTICAASPNSYRRKRWRVFSSSSRSPPKACSRTIRSRTWQRISNRFTPANELEERVDDLLGRCRSQPARSLGEAVRRAPTFQASARR